MQRSVAYSNIHQSKMDGFVHEYTTTSSPAYVKTTIRKTPKRQSLLIQSHNGRLDCDDEDNLN